MHKEKNKTKTSFYYYYYYYLTFKAIELFDDKILRPAYDQTYHVSII